MSIPRLAPRRESSCSSVRMFLRSVVIVLLLVIGGRPALRLVLRNFKENRRQPHQDRRHSGVSGRSLLLQPIAPTGAASIASLIFVARLLDTKQKAGRGKGRKPSDLSTPRLGLAFFFLRAGRATYSIVAYTIAQTFSRCQGHLAADSFPLWLKAIPPATLSPNGRVGKKTTAGSR
jgi:hypothetical protein